MKKLAILFIPIILACLVNNSFAATYYVSYSSGNDANSGTSLGAQFKTISKANSVAVAGDIIYLRGEVHSYTTKIDLNKNGTAANKISLLAYPGDATRPTINFTGQAIGIRGIQLSGTYWYIKGIDICKSGDNGMHISGAYNIVEFCSFYENQDTGLQLANGANNNKIINCDSYYNRDATTTPIPDGNADGFACKLDVGTGNSFKGCRAWQNSDDGWDGLLSTGFGQNPSTTYDSCWCFLNGYLKDMSASQGNGNGFKMGGNQELHDATLRNCLSVYNRNKGFDQNNDKGSMILYNCTGYKNNPNFGMNNYDPAAGKVMVVKNCVSFQSRSAADVFRAVATRSNNSWQISGYTPSTTDFVSLDTSVLRGPRNSDGSLPTITLLKPKQYTALVNAGTDVGLPYYGFAPDIGYVETNYTLPVELLSFSAAVKNGKVELSWRTATEIQNKGWDIERYVPGSIAWQKLGFVQGKGNSTIANSYSFIDEKPADANAIQYRLKQIDENGNYKYSNVITVKFASGKTELSNYPNPVKEGTVAKFNITHTAKVKLDVYNSSGQLVKQVANETLTAGFHSFNINTAAFAAGQYMLNLVVDDVMYTHTMLKVK